MTDRYLVVGAHDSMQALATAIQVVMDLYVRIQRDVVLVTKDLLEAQQAVAKLVGEEAARDLAEAPQAFAGHTIRLVAAEEAESGLNDELVVAHHADDALLERLDGVSSVTAVVAAPQDAVSASGWAERHRPLEVAPRE